MSLAGQLDRALRAANIPIDGVSVGDDQNRASWRVAFSARATADDRVTAAALLAIFDPSDPEVVAAERTRSAQSLMTPELITFYEFWFEKTNGRLPTDEERAADAQRLVELYTRPR